MIAPCLHYGGAKKKKKRRAQLVKNKNKNVKRDCGIAGCRNRSVQPGGYFGHRSLQARAHRQLKKSNICIPIRLARHQDAANAQTSHPGTMLSSVFFAGSIGGAIPAMSSNWTCRTWSLGAALNAFVICSSCGVKQRSSICTD